MYQPPANEIDELHYSRAEGIRITTTDGRTIAVSGDINFGKTNGSLDVHQHPEVEYGTNLVITTAAGRTECTVKLEVYVNTPTVVIRLPEVQDAATD